MRKTASRNKNVSGAADSGESRDGGTRAVSFSGPLPKTYREVHALDKNLLAAALAEALRQEPDATIIEVACEIAPAFQPGRNAEFTAIGFAAAYQYFQEISTNALLASQSKDAEVPK